MKRSRSPMMTQYSVIDHKPPSKLTSLFVFRIFDIRSSSLIGPVTLTSCVSRLTSKLETAPIVSLSQRFKFAPRVMAIAPSSCAFFNTRVTAPEQPPQVIYVNTISVMLTSVRNQQTLTLSWYLCSTAAVSDSMIGWVQASVSVLISYRETDRNTKGGRLSML